MAHGALTEPGRLGVLAPPPSRRPTRHSHSGRQPVACGPSSKPSAGGGNHSGSPPPSSSPSSATASRMEKPGSGSCSSTGRISGRIRAAIRSRSSTSVQRSRYGGSQWASCTT